MIRRALIATVLFTSLQATPVQAEWNHPLPKDVYLQLSICETGKRPDQAVTHMSRSYVGAFGFAKTTWRMFSDTPVHRAKHLTWAQHARVLDRAFWFGHTRNGRKQWAVGPFGHGCWKHLYASSPKLRHMVCHNAKRQVRKWCR